MDSQFCGVFLAASIQALFAAFSFYSRFSSIVHETRVTTN